MRRIAEHAVLFRALFPIAHVVGRQEVKMKEQSNSSLARFGLVSEKDRGSQSGGVQDMYRETKRSMNHRRVTTGEPQPLKGASPDLRTVPDGSQAGSQPAKIDAKVDVSPQGALPVLSVPGGNQTDSKTHKSGEDTNAEVSSQGALPVITARGESLDA